MNARSFLLAFVLGAVLAGVPTWLVLRGKGGGAGSALDRPPAAGPGSGLPVSATGDPAAGGAPAGQVAGETLADAVLRGAPGALDRVLAIEAQNKDLAKEVGDLKAEIERLTPLPADPQAFRFGIPTTSPAFDQAKWGEMAEHTKALAGSMIELRDTIVSGGELSPKLISDLQKHNMPLVAFAIAFSGEVDDPTVNGAYTHPAVLANLIRAALLGANDPLSRDQEIAVKTLGDAWVAENGRFLSSISPAAPALARTVAEVDAKLRFLAAVKNVLSSNQRGILFHPETEGRLQLDLLSPVLTYVLSFPVEAKSREEMATKLVNQLLTTAAVESKEEEVLRYEWIGRQWVEDLGGLLEPVSLTDANFRFPHVDVVQARARAQVAATERMLAVGSLAPEQAERLRQATSLFYPYVVR